VIPVKNNQDGLNQFINKFNESHSKKNSPLEMIIVDNNSVPTIKLSMKDVCCPVKIIKCKDPGPACARNKGWKEAQAEWILFTDSDCIPSESLISGYIEASNGSLGYAGNVLPVHQDPISKYYESQGTLIPSRHLIDGKEYPDYLVTANCLVWKKALEFVGGFNESMTLSAGEDIDIGFRLREKGNLGFAWNSLVYHNFDDGLIGFIKRFWRYGRGNGQLSKILSLDMKPRGIFPQKPSRINYLLSKIQHLSLLGGYLSENSFRKRVML